MADNPRSGGIRLNATGDPVPLVAARLALMRHQRPPEIRWLRGVDREQHSVNSAICAKDTQKYAENCGATEQKTNKKCVQDTAFSRSRLVNWRGRK